MGEDPFTPPLIPHEWMEQISVAIQSVATEYQAFVEAVVASLELDAPDPHGNRAARRRKRALPERPGWMAAFPPSDPARLSKGRR